MDTAPSTGSHTPMPDPAGLVSMSIRHQAAQGTALHDALVTLRMMVDASRQGLSRLGVTDTDWLDAIYDEAGKRFGALHRPDTEREDTDDGGNTGCSQAGPAGPAAR